MEYWCMYGILMKLLLMLLTVQHTFQGQSADSAGPHGATWMQLRRRAWAATMLRWVGVETFLAVTTVPSLPRPQASLGHFPLWNMLRKWYIMKFMIASESTFSDCFNELHYNGTHWLYNLCYYLYVCTQEVQTVFVYGSERSQSSIREYMTVFLFWIWLWRRVRIYMNMIIMLTEKSSLLYLHVSLECDDEEKNVVFFYYMK